MLQYFMSNKQCPHKAQSSHTWRNSKPPFLVRLQPITSCYLVLLKHYIGQPCVQLASNACSKVNHIIFTTLQSAGTRFTDNAYMYLLANYLKHQSTCSLIIDNIDLLVVRDLIYVHFHRMMNQTSSMVRSDTKTIISQKYKQISLRCVIYIDCGVRDDILLQKDCKQMLWWYHDE